MQGFKIETEISELEILNALKAIDNTFGPLGSGGHSVRTKKETAFKVITFTDLDCAPARNLCVIVAGKIIYCNQAYPIVQYALNRKGIAYTLHNKCQMPDNIAHYIKAKMRT